MEDAPPRDILERCEFTDADAQGYVARYIMAVVPKTGPPSESDEQPKESVLEVCALLRECRRATFYVAQPITSPKATHCRRGHWAYAFRVLKASYRR